MKAEKLMMTQSRGRMADGHHCVWAKGSAEHRYRRKRRICELARKEAVEEWWCGSRGDCARLPVTPHNANPDPLLLIVTLTNLPPLTDLHEITETTKRVLSSLTMHNKCCPLRSAGNGGGGRL